MVVASAWETHRLRLRVPCLADACPLFTFMGDREAMRFTISFATERDCRRHLAAHARQRRRLGFGPWTIIEKASGSVVGLGGLYDDPFEPGWGPEIGYHFAPSAWGKGYATELVRLCLTEAYTSLGLTEVKAFTHPNNVASRRVLQKAGFERGQFIQSMQRDLFRHAKIVSRSG